MDKDGSPVLDDRQRSLYEALSKEDLRLARYYLSALWVWEQDGNPDRFAMAAHGLREVAEKLPRYRNFPIPGKRVSLTQQVRSIQQCWQNVLTRSKCRTNSGWEGAIDRDMAAFLAKVHNFFEWVEQERPTRKEQTRRMVRALDPIGRALPPPIEGLRIEEWDKYHDYFDSVSHHNFEPESQDFRNWVRAFEGFLLDRLCPRTFEDHANLDELIREGDEGGQA